MTTKLKVNLLLDEDLRSEVFKLIREQLRPLTREFIAETMTPALVEKAVAQVVSQGLIKAIAQELRFHVAKEIVKQPDVLRSLEHINEHAERAVEKALLDKNLTPLINAAVRKSVGALVAQGKLG